MNEKDFVALCKKTVADYANIHEDDVYIVWMCKTLQNSKALASTNVSDGMYYELTYNGNKGELYVDAYKKQHNFVVII
jgi:hypothetical protein